MKIVKKYEDGDEYTLVIKPEGWVREIVFEFGYIHSCGQAEAGIGIRISDDPGGGVLTLDDLLAIQTIIAEHFKRVSKMVGDGIGIDSILYEGIDKEDNE